MRTKFVKGWGRFGPKETGMRFFGNLVLVHGGRDNLQVEV